MSHTPAISRFTKIQSIMETKSPDFLVGLTNDQRLIVVPAKSYEAAAQQLEVLAHRGEGIEVGNMFEVAIEEQLNGIFERMASAPAILAMTA